MREIRELQPGDHVEHHALSWTVERLRTIPEADSAVQGAWSPLVHPDEVQIDIGNGWERTDGRRLVSVVGCDGCGSRHKPANCRRRSV